MRHFKTILFMGNGQHSMDQVTVLKDNLNRAIKISGGLQQPCHCEGPNCPCKEADLKYRTEVEDAVRDIAAALLGREIEFGEETPYLHGRLAKTGSIRPGPHAVSTERVTTDTFTLTKEHIKLLQNAWVTWNDVETGAPTIDPKRPYGNSYIPGDVAKILGFSNLPEDYDEFSSDEATELFRIHEQTETALQIVLQLKTFEPGTFKKVSPFSNVWERVK